MVEVVRQEVVDVAEEAEEAAEEVVAEEAEEVAEEAVEEAGSPAIASSDSCTAPLSSWPFGPKAVRPIAS